MNSNFSLFGFAFPSKKEEYASPVDKDTDATVKLDSAPGFISPHVTSMSMDNLAATENDFIARYREISMIPEVQACVEEIVSEAVITDADDLYVTPNLDRVEQSDSIKKRINEEFERIYNLLMFSRKGHDIFRRWFIDGRLNYNVLVDFENPKAGIQGLRYIDPRKIKKVRENIKQKDPKTGVLAVIDTKEYFLFNDRGVGSNVNNNSAPGSIQTNSSSAFTNDVPMTAESVVYVPSGLTDSNMGFTISYLHTALRTANNLRMMEDAALIYKLVRAPERRVFYIDTGNLPKAKAAQYVQEIADKNKTKVVYDVNSGEIRNDRRYMAMTEDFWIPRKEGSRGTEISTLPGGDNSGDMTESQYFKDKLYTALNVPKSRFADQPTLFSGGTQVTRDEIRFSRYINKLRTKFSLLFEELLGRQLILKGVMTAEEWDDIKVNIDYEFAEDSYFAEALKTEKLQGKLQALNAISDYVGVYISKEYVWKQIFNFSDEQIKHEIETMAKEGPIDDDADDEDRQEPEPKSESVESDSSDGAFIVESLLDLKDSEVELNQALVDFLKK